MNDRLTTGVILAEELACRQQDAPSFAGHRP
jgi:hypothetical protein